MSKEGGGAGNNWASGFTQGQQVEEALLDMMGKQAALPTHLLRIFTCELPAGIIT